MSPTKSAVYERNCFRGRYFKSLANFNRVVSRMYRQAGREIQERRGRAATSLFRGDD